jgi:Ca2+-binding RTX toxin-like protein
MQPTETSSRTFIYSPFDMQDFFAPANDQIVSITGLTTSARVTLSSGVVLLYRGSDLSYSRTAPKGGTVDSVTALDANGKIIATLSLKGAPWNFAEITTDAPLNSYLSNPTFIDEPYQVDPRPAENDLLGGNKSDFISWFDGAKTVRGLDGDDTFRKFLNYSSQTPELIDGGNGKDTLKLVLADGDFRETTLLSIEAISIDQGNMQISASQIGNGQIARDASIRIIENASLSIDQVEGSSVSLSSFKVQGLIGPNETFGYISIGGTDANDLQVGSSEGDILFGVGGNDTLYGNGGNDRIIGGAGNDKLYAGTAYSFFRSTDRLEGGAGNDTLVGGESSEFLSGDGSAMFLGGTGNDVYIISTATTKIQELANEGYDRVVTSVDLNLSDGESSSDAGSIERIEIKSNVGLTVTGSASNNQIFGNVGADVLNGVAGDDRLQGGIGNDVMSGGTGLDVMTGGAGSDRFVFSNGFGKDVVNDFASGTDVIDLSALDTITSFDDLTADHIRQVGRNVWIEGDDSDVLILRDVSLSSLDASDFLF